MKKSRPKRITSGYSHIVKRLGILAQNLWWSWNPHAQAIFEELSPLTWHTSNHNPIEVLNQVSNEELTARLGNKEFRQRITMVLKLFDQYVHSKSSATPQSKKKKGGAVAYFCAEFGLHESLPLYSGGLGVLAGDHVKSASDLGVQLVGVGLFYRQGYFQQHIDQNGQQQESYPTLNPSKVPVELVKDYFGKPLLCSVTIGTSVVFFQGWRVNVGRCHVYLLDTDVAENPEHVRGLTSLAYGGDISTRIRQEIVLGIGGVRFLRALAIHPAVFHMNEGHAAFLTIELLHEQLQQGIPKAKAERTVRDHCIFTTHTPVAAGHDRFPYDLIEFTLRPYLESMKLSMKEFMSYGQLQNVPETSEFTMTILGLRFSRAANAVSKKHKEVSQLMWKELFPWVKREDVPIGYVTNGVHLPSWTTRTSWEFWERHNSHKWKEHLHDPRFWDHVADPSIVSDEELWALRYELRRALIEFVRRQARDGHVYGSPHGEGALNNLFSFDALTLGFARRFAPYKRAPMLFSDLSRVLMLFNDPQRPVQILYAGKAHPRDGDGKELLRQVVEVTRQSPFHGKVLFLENYDMNIARHLVTGCDVWLNTPRRPLEASGTSGQKITINGGLHCSILDGWWLEGYNGRNGWAIGGKVDERTPSDELDKRESESLYDVLGNDILPAFYQRDHNGIPRKWIEKMRNAMRSIVPVYNTHRMVSEYNGRYYFP